jgi:predicted negative regulator of RcsB-dependent stress response
MAESTLVAALQEQIDSVTERMKSSESQLSQLQLKLKTLTDALTGIDQEEADTLSASSRKLSTEALPHQELSAEARQSRERAIRAFNLNPRRGVELIVEAIGGSTGDLAAFLVGA